ncbi:MAG: hypothetical protein K2Q20_01465, partial [Phycisphaerales bacterium]|nr:hypothetical protein [Phycisphaerales bacterium]
MGTRDGESPCWQTVGGASGQDNTVLTARHFYGLGINNIRQPVLTRRYRTPVNCSQTDFHGQGDSSFLSDKAGWEEAYGYDRRGRRSVVEHYGKSEDAPAGSARPGASNSASDGTFGEAAVNTSRDESPKLLRAEYTWYDHQDRVRFTATFGPTEAELVRSDSGSGSINPRVRDVYTLGDPSAQDILAAGPLELRENVYNDRGELAEQRTYSVSTSATDAGYESSRMYYDHAGRVLVRISSSGHWERSTYDALGRLVATTTMRGAPANVFTGTDYELERRDYAYHENGQPERTSAVTRVSDNSEAALKTGPGGNAVRTDQLTWYDDNARVIATASFGTNAATDEYTNDTSTPPSGPTQAGADRPPPTFDNTTGLWML